MIRKKILEKKLFKAVEKNDLVLTAEILDKGIHPDIRGKYWNWPLVLSASTNLPMLRLLVENGADINVCEENKFYSPLIIATRQNASRCVEYLLSCGADTHHTSFAGLPALFYALEFGFTDIIILLVDHEKDAAFLEDVKSLCHEKNISVHMHKNLIDKRIKELCI